jgi:hypothetical protein
MRDSNTPASREVSAAMHFLFVYSIFSQQRVIGVRLDTPTRSAICTEGSCVFVRPMVDNRIFRFPPNFLRHFCFCLKPSAHSASSKHKEEMLSPASNQPAGLFAFVRALRFILLV